MSFTDEYFAIQKKKRKEEAEKKKTSQKTTTKSTGHSFTDEYFAQQSTTRKEKDIAPVFVNKTASLYSDPEKFIAPVTRVTGTTKKEEKDERKWFQKGEFEDGYQIGDITKTILGTKTDISENLLTGVLGMGEKAVDAGAYIVGGVGGLFGNDDLKDTMSGFIKKDLYDEEKIAKKIMGVSGTGTLNKLIGVDSEGSSVLGEKSDALVQSAGQLAGTLGLQAVGVPWFVTSGVVGFGSEAENALNQGATYGQAGMSAAISAGAEILTEKLFGGSGLGETGLIAVDRLTKGITNKAVKALADYGVDILAEGSEEVISEFMSNLGSSLYKEKKLGEILFSEEAIDGYIESFIGGGVLGGVMNASNAVRSVKSGRDYRSGLSVNEQKVVEKEVENRIAEQEKGGKKLTDKEKAALEEAVIRDMEKGYISTDTIEEVLGGETYKTYKDTIDREDALQQEYEELGKKQNATLAEQTRYNELHQQVNELKTSSQRNQLKEQLGNEVMSLVQRSYLAESYNERSRRGQAFEADLTKYDTKQQETIKKAVESGILNNTNRTHEFVDMIAKISADKGVLFDFTNNERLKESDFAVEDKQVNGYVTKDGVTLNIDSAKSLNSVVGHEITHVLEGTELYTALQSAVVEYAKTKGDYQGRYDSLSKLYQNVEGADVNAELTADLVGDYLFTDTDFINNLSVQHRNVFQKIYDEIKYLCKVATAGSKEARELEKVKRAFEKAYQESGKTEGTKYSVSDVKDELFERLSAKRKELNESSWLQDDIEDSEEYNALIKEIVSSGASPEALAKYKEWDAKTGYSALVEKNKQLAKEARELAAQHDKAVRESWVADEAKAIAKSGLTEADYFRKQAVKEFGYTPYFYDAGYITTNGKMLNFSGEKGKHFGSRGQDHRAIGTIYADTDGTNALNRFVKDGNIRIMAESPGIDISATTEPTKEQYATIRKFASEYSDKGYFSIDLTGEDGRVVGSLTYQNRINPTRIVNDIKHFYATGEIRQQSEVDRLRYSLSDSDGKQLTKEQQEYFKDSKVRDENGRLKVVYHGTPNGDFTVFKDGTYFTDNKEYADRYQSTSASSISSGKVATNPKTFEVYLDIKKPFDITDEEARDIYINEYIKGGNAMGINPYLSDAEYRKIKTIDWTEGEDLRDFLIEEGYDYDGLVLDEGADGGYGDEVSYRGKSYVVFSSEQVKSIDNTKPTADPDIRRSLSREGEQVAPIGKYNVYGKDIALETAPVQETQLNGENATENATPVPEDLFPDDLAPMADDPERLNSLTDADMPPETNVPYTEDGEVTVDDPFEERDWYQVGNRKVNAYMYENPEVKPFFQEEAAALLGELNDTIKGEKWYNDDLYYQTNGEQGFGGMKRMTSDSIAEMLDGWGMSYADIEKGLEAIIKDNGAENIAAAKKIEFMLNERLLNGYKDYYTNEYIQPNEEYINLLNEKQITQYSKEAFDAFMANADSYAPPVEEDIAPVAKPSMPVSERRGPYMAANAPVEKYEAIRPKREKQPRLARATPEEQARAEIMVDEPKVEKKKSGLWSMVKNNVIDKGAVFETLSLKTKNRELQAKWHGIRNAEGRAQWLMEKGNANTKSLDAIRKQVEGIGKTKQFYEYLYHMHNADRMTLEDRYADVENKPVFGSSITADISNLEVAELEKRNPEFKRLAQEVYKYMGNLREMLVDGGVISEETAALWSEMYPHYVPIRREGHDGLNINVPLDTGRTGINAPVKRATGGSSNILPLFDTMAMRTEQTFKAIAKNRFGVELKNTLGTAVGSEAMSLDEAIEGVDTHEELLQEGKNGRSPTFTVFENGEKVTFEITQEMYDAMKPKSKAMAYTNKAVNKLNNLRRGLLTEYNPAFMLTNPIKDTQDVLVNSQHPVRTYANFPSAIVELLGKNGQYYQEYMEHGGGQNRYFDGETNTFTPEKSGLSKVIGFPLEKISAINNFIERVPRMAEYIASRKAGRSIDVSMLDAARVTTNFAAGGDLTKMLNRNGFTFLNASVQGTVQQVRNFREAKYNGFKGWAQLAGKTVAAGLPAILLNHLLWEDDEEYEELSDYVKQDYYIVGKFGDGKFVRIPKGRALAVIQNAFEQMENLITGNDEVDLQAFTDLVSSNLLPNNPLDNNLIAPIAQTLRNETWYGEDLVPTRLQDLPAAEQYDESTDSLSKWLGEKTNLSPVKINYLLDQYSGALGDMFLPMMTPEAESGDSSARGKLLAPLKDKFTTDAVMNNQNVSDFYDKKDELTVNANATGATDEDVLKNKYMNSVNADLAKLYAEKRKIQNSDLPDAEKYAAVRDVQSQIVALTRESLGTYENISYEEDDIAVIGDKYFKQNDEGEWSKLSDDQVRKHEITSEAGDAPYATDGDIHYRYYEPDEDSTAEAGWRKLTDEQVKKQEEVTKGLGISAEEYWGNKEEYDYAYEHPESYAVAKAVGGYEAYRGYSSEMYDIKADKDSNGKSISGSRKEKIWDYVNGLDIEDGEKYILFKKEYNADDTYNYEIIDYLNSREDISYEDMETILKKLGFTVSANGDISW